MQEIQQGTEPWLWVLQCPGQTFPQLPAQQNECGAQNSRSINTGRHSFLIPFFLLHFLWARPSSIRQNPA